MAIADGVAKLEGLSGAMYNEMIDFGQGVFGIALNLEEDEVGCVILGDYSKLKEGDEASTTGRLLSVPVGMGLLGRVVDAIGNQSTARAQSTPAKLIQSTSRTWYYSSQISRSSDADRHHVDRSMIPSAVVSASLSLGPLDGQDHHRDRRSSIRRRSTASIATKTALSRNFRPVYSIYVAVGQKNSNIAHAHSPEGAGAMEYTISLLPVVTIPPTNTSHHSLAHLWGSSS